MIAFMNFKRSDISDKFRTDVALMDMENHTLFTNKMRMVFLQLPLITKEPDECDTLFDKII